MRSVEGSPPPRVSRNGICDSKHLSKWQYYQRAKAAGCCHRSSRDDALVACYPAGEAEATRYKACAAGVPHVVALLVLPRVVETFTRNGDECGGERYLSMCECVRQIKQYAPKRSKLHNKRGYRSDL